MGNGNTGIVHSNTSLLAVEGTLPQVTVTSDEIDAQLMPAYDRLRTRPGMLEKLAGVLERRWWPHDVSFTDAAAMAG